MKILVVDDDEVMRKLVREVLEREGYLVQLAASGEEALKAIRRETFPIILSDIRMEGMDGVGVLREIKKSNKSSAVILMTGFGSMEGAIEAIHEGAFDYVSKPFKMDELKAVVAKAAKHWESIRSQGFLTKVPAGVASNVLIGKSPRIVEVYKTLARATMSASNVLLSGEKGTGKNLVARAIHDNGDRRNKPFIAVNCAAFPENLLDVELFGDLEKNSSKPLSEKRGLFEMAGGGTLFLEEVSETPSSIQVKLFRAIQEDCAHLNVRVIAATDHDLEPLVKAAKFREDLYYSLKIISIELPPLRERMDDLPELVDHFLARYAEKNKKPVSHVSSEVMQKLKSYRWPGNVRELERAIERAVAMTNSSVLLPEDFPLEEIGERELSERQEESAVRSPEFPVGEQAQENVTSLEEMERLHIIKVLQEVRYNKSKASEVLGIDRATLYRKAQKYGIDLRGK